MQGGMEGDGLDHEGRAFVADCTLILDNFRIANAGGYTPPDGDPGKCEPTPTASPGNKGGFDYRVEHKRTLPFDRCGEIGCTVQAECTALVLKTIATGK